MEEENFDLEDFDMSVLEANLLPNMFSTQTSSMENLSSPIIKEDVCRICLQTHGLQLITEEINKMLYVTNRPTHSKYPNYICSDCLESLTYAFNFLNVMDLSTAYLNEHYDIDDRQLFNSDCMENTQFEILDNSQLEPLDNAQSENAGNTQFDLLQSFCDGTNQFSIENYIIDNNQLELVDNYVIDNKQLELLEGFKEQRPLMCDLEVSLPKYTMEDLKRMKYNLKRAAKRKLPRKQAANKINLLKLAEESDKVLQDNSPTVIRQKLENILKESNPFLCKLEINTTPALKSDLKIYPKKSNRPLKMKNFTLSTTYKEFNQTFRNNIKRNKTVDRNGKVSVVAKAYPCRKCKKLFLKKSTILRHMCSGGLRKKVLKKEALKCNICQEVCPDILAMSLHQCTTLRCEICPLEFQLQDDLNNHKCVPLIFEINSSDYNTQP